MKKKIIMGGAITLVIVLFLSVYIAKNSGTTQVFSGGKTFSVKVKKVEKGDISASITASGITEETDASAVYFDTPVKVNKILIKQNQKVSKGDKILDLDLADLNSQLEQLKLSRDVLALSIKKIMDMDTTTGTSTLDTAVSIAENTLKNAQDSYNDGKKNYDDSKAAYERLEISSTELDAVKKALNSAKLALENAKLNYQTSLENLNTAKKGNSQSENSKSIDIESQEKNLKATDLKITEMETKIKDMYESMLSPMDGMISEINVTEGAYTSNMESAFRIVNPSKLQAKAWIKEFDIKDVAAGQNVKVTGDAIEKDVVITGKIISISPVAIKNRTSSGEETVVEAVVSIDNTDVDLKAGLNISCEVITNDKKGVLVADFEMIKEDKDGNKYVYIVDKDNIIKKQNVKLGVNSDMIVEVLSGINEGEMVIINPPLNIKDGSKAKVINDEKK